MFVRQLCGSEAEVSLVQISCHPLTPQRVEGGGRGGRGHFRGGGEALFGLAPGTGLEGAGEERRECSVRLK